MKLLSFLFPDNKSESFKIAGITKSEFIKRLGDSIKCEKKELFKDVFTIHFREDYFEMEREKLFRSGKLTGIGKLIQQGADLIVSIEYQEDKLPQRMVIIIMLVFFIVFMIETINGSMDTQGFAFLGMPLVVFIAILISYSFSSNNEIERINARIKKDFENVESFKLEQIQGQK